MQRQAIGGGVTIGIVVYSGWGDQLRAAMSLAGLWRDQGKARVERGVEVRPGEFEYELTGAGTPIRGVSTQPLLDACRELKRMGADPARYCGLFRPGREDWDLRCKIGVGAELTVSDLGLRPSRKGSTYRARQEKPAVRLRVGQCHSTRCFAPHPQQFAK
jgi:hypothetical protein